MTDTKNREKPQVKTRPAGKLPSGFDKVGSRKPDGANVAEILGIAQPTPPTPRTPPTSPTDATPPIAPERDFVRVPNSVARDVVPAGHFTGKSKQLYDCLYQRTRGAIAPTRSVAISKPELMRASGIGSERTLLKNLAHLRALGLLSVTFTDGKHEGNTYEVLTPEEAGLRTPPTPPTPPTAGTPRHPRAEVPPVPPVESGVRGVGSEPAESTTYEPPKTSFKTNTESDDDDAALAGAVAALKSANKEITGKDLSRADADRWREVADVIVAELKIAAARTTVSNVPAFLAEHLRRRLWKIDKKQASAEGKELPDQALSTTAQEDAKACPDCGGSGWWYPEGIDRGVKKCRHEKLKERTEEAD